jgi:uncharacterized protein DUF3592
MTKSSDVPPIRVWSRFPRLHVGRPVVIAVVVLCLAVASAVVWAAAGVRQRDVRIRDHGVLVSGSVAEIVIGKGSRSVRVSFSTRDGRKIVTVPESFQGAGKAFVGQTRTLRYDPEHPDRGPQDIGVPPDEWSAFIALLAVAGFSAAVGAGFWWSAQLGRRDAARRPRGKAERWRS